MSHVFVVQVKNLSTVVELYSENIKYPSKIIIAKEIPKLVFDLKIFSKNTLILFFFILNVLKSSN